MDDLETYVTSGLREDEEVIRELNSSVKDTINLFAKIPFDETSSPPLWPYLVLDRDRKNFRNLSQSDARPPPGKLSQSTTSMIVAALRAATSDQKYRYSSGYTWAGSVGAELIQPEDDLKKRTEIALNTLEARWNALKDDKEKTSSQTFGNDDILTLSWHLDLFSKESSIAEQARKIVAERISAYAKATSGHEGVVRSFSNHEAGSGRMVMDSAYNLLRLVRCMPSITNELKEKDDLTRAKDRAFYRFQSRLHDHLSFSAITDSRFDGSELAFCLEGMLQLRSDSVNAQLLERVMEVLQVAQDRTPYWSSDMPMVADHKGQVLYPSSVEIARSLLASISIFDTENARTSFHNSAGSKYLHLIKRYWQWLKTRRTTITTEKSGEILGWHSEHLNDTALIHTWETSHILEFCVAFRDQMLRYISRNLLMASRLDVKWPKALKGTWEEIVEEFEPATLIEPEFQPYAAVHENFIKPFKNPDAKKAYWSILLYGPPGTGKTEFADNIAGFLEVPVITLTVSDFLAEGEGRMENRAKLVFDVLSRQSSAVVIFDEMDQFLLDRDSQRFRDQGSAFQFLTPGMLTKFGALRKKASVLFIIATNYEERIDPAIKRTGRIDLQYLLLPPDGAQRLKIINRFVKFDVEALSTNEKAEIVAASAFLGYSDLKRVASDDNAVKDGINGFVDRLDRASRNIQFYSYKDRFAKSNKTVNLSSGPRLELLSLFKLAQDAWGTDAAWIEKAKTFECGRTFVEALVDDLLNVKVSGQSKPGFVNELKKQGIELPK